MPLLCASCELNNETKNQTREQLQNSTVHSVFFLSRLLAHCFGRRAWPNSSREQSAATAAAVAAVTVLLPDPKRTLTLVVVSKNNTRTHNRRRLCVCGVVWRESFIWFVSVCVCALAGETYTHTHTHRVSLRDPTRELSIAFHTEATEIAPSIHTQHSSSSSCCCVAATRRTQRWRPRTPRCVCVCVRVAPWHSSTVDREREREGVCARSATPPKTET